MTPKVEHSPSRTRHGPNNPTPNERIFVLAGLGLAVLHTAASVAFGVGADHTGPLWMAAIAWTAIASLSAALWRGLRNRDWSAFSCYEFPDNRDERLDWDTRTGRYAWMRDWEDRQWHDDNYFHNHNQSLPW